MRIFPLIAFIALATSAPCAALAQEAPAPTAPQATVPVAPASAVGSDVVHLSNGGMVRGTVSEYMPGSHVVIVTAAGESMRFTAAEIASVNVGAATPVTPAPVVQAAPVPAPVVPAAALAATPALATPAVQARPVVHAQDARFRFESREPGLTLHLRTGVAVSTDGIGAVGYEPVCAAPCEASLPRGMYDFGISSGGGLPVAVSEPLRIQGGETLEARMGSRKKARIVVLAIGGVMAAIGFGLVLKNLDRPESDEDDPNETPRNVGYGLGFGGVFLAGGGMVFIRDQPELRIKPAAR